jgi:hypothetical protein
MAGVQGHPDAPAAEFGPALRPGAIALVVFVDRAKAPVARMGFQTLGAQVLSADDLRRIGAGAAGVATSGLQGGEAGQGFGPGPQPGIRLAGRVRLYPRRSGPDLWVPVCVWGPDPLQVGHSDPQRPRGRPAPVGDRFWHAARVTNATWENGVEHSGSRGWLTRKRTEVQLLPRPPTHADQSVCGVGDPYWRAGSVGVEVQCRESTN